MKNKNSLNSCMLLLQEELALIHILDFSSLLTNSGIKYHISWHSNAGLCGLWRAGLKSDPTAETSGETGAL